MAIASLLDFTNFLSNDLTGIQIAASPFGPSDSIDLSTSPFAVLDENGKVLLTEKGAYSDAKIDRIAEMVELQE